MNVALPLLRMTPEQRQAFGCRPTVGEHRLAADGLVDDAALAALLDRFPRERLQVRSTGSDPSRLDQNRAARHRGADGAALLRAVHDGRLWLNLTRVDLAEPGWRTLIDRLYGDIAAQRPGFAPSSSQGALLISSPQALVYYHVDGPASVLWHLRGHKRVWVYPALDERFAAREAVEEIFASVRDEYLPYQPAFDAEAFVHDLQPGQWIAWAQNAPHRVSNLDGLNVSLATEHFTPQSRARARVWAANHYLRVAWGLHGLATRETGAAALLKALVHRVARAARSTRPDPARDGRHRPGLRVDPDAPGGVVPRRGPGEVPT